MRLNQLQPIGMFLCGDVMTGRGIDQVLAHPGDPMLYEPCVRDAREYVHLAECANGPIPVRERENGRLALSSMCIA